MFCRILLSKWNRIKWSIMIFVWIRIVDKSMSDLSKWTLRQYYERVKSVHVLIVKNLCVWQDHITRLRFWRSFKDLTQLLWRFLRHYESGIIASSERELHLDWIEVIEDSSLLEGFRRILVTNSHDYAEILYRYHRSLEGLMISFKLLDEFKHRGLEWSIECMKPWKFTEKPWRT